MNRVPSTSLQFVALMYMKNVGITPWKIGVETGLRDAYLHVKYFKLRGETWGWNVSLSETRNSHIRKNWRCAENCDTF